MVLRVSDLGPNCCESEIPAHDDQHKIGNNSMKKNHLHPRTEEGTFGGDDQEEDKELVRKMKKVKKENPETEACFVALVTDSNLQNDALELPKDFTISNGLKRECRKIILTDKGEKAWSMDLRFNESSQTLYISRGWRCFCNENSEKAGGFITFNLVGNGEIPVLSFCPKETKQKASRRESLSTQVSSKKEENIEEENSDDEEMEKKKSGKHRLLTLTPTHASLTASRQSLPLPFVRENGMTRPAVITLLGKNGKEWPVNLIRNGKQLRCLGKGWKDFVNANGKVGESFTFELVSESETPVLRLLGTESTRQQGECSKEPSSGNKTRKAKTNSEERRDDSSNDGDNTELARKKKKVNKENSEREADSSSCFVALVTASNLQKDALELPKDFTTSNRFKRECREIVLTGKGERAWSLDLKFNESTETFYVSRGWRCFCNENSKKAGGLFIFNLVGNGEVPVLSFCPKETSQKAIRRESLSTQLSSEEENKEEEESSEDNLRVTLTITPYCVRKTRLVLPLKFTRESGINEPGIITLQGKDGVKQQTKLLLHKGRGNMYLGSGWKVFAKANGLKIGEAFTLELIRENGTPMLRLLSNESTRHQRECSKEPSSGNKTKKAKSNKEGRRNGPFSPSQNRFVRLTPTHASLRTHRQPLPVPFVRENGMTRAGLITLVGKNGTKWPVNLMRNGKQLVCLGKGWIEFFNGNGLKVGESFTLELIWENAIPTLRLLGTESTRQQGECSKEPSSGEKTRKAKKNSEEMKEEPSSSNENRFVTLRLTPQDVRECKLDLPTQFMRDNGINKLGKMTLLGEKGKNWFGYLLSKDGTVAMGSGWKSFCESNGVKIGKSFTLEFIDKQGTYDFVCNFSPNSRD